MKPIPFNKPHLTKGTMLNLLKVALSGTIAGNGEFTKKCQNWFEEKYGFRKALLTTSCTDALEMSALLCGIGPGDEVILPSFTFMSTANAFLLRGARLLFADTLEHTPNIDPGEIERLSTAGTKAVVVVHYSGIACDMDLIMEAARSRGLRVVEDAAHAVDSFYRGRPLGSIGDLGAFSFHETKNIISGEGGLLAVNNESFLQRSEIVWEKGTNRAAFYRGEIDKYGWVDLGSSFLPSDAVAAVLWAQLSQIETIQSRRKKLWHLYHELLAPLESKGFLRRPVIPGFATVNGNLYYFTVDEGDVRDRLLAYLKNNGIHAVFHYLPLHTSSFFSDQYRGKPLPNTERFSRCIVRLPFFYSLRPSQAACISGKIAEFFQGRR